MTPAPGAAPSCRTSPRAGTRRLRGGHTVERGCSLTYLILVDSVSVGEDLDENERVGAAVVLDHIHVGV